MTKRFQTDVVKLTNRELERFWSFVNKTDTCWIWTGAIDKQTGYGRIHFRGKSIAAHKISFYIHKGPTGKHVLHECDNRKCIRPEHLFDGTNLDNINDRISKGRTWSKVTKEQEKSIVELCNNESQRKVAKQFKITQSGVWRILQRNKLYRGKA